MEKTGIDKSLEKFEKREGKIYENVQFRNELVFSVMEFRKRTFDGKLCLIELLKNGKGYRIYELVLSNIEEKEIFKPRQQELDF